MKKPPNNSHGQASLEMTIALVAILVMILETLISIKGLPFISN